MYSNQDLKQRLAVDAALNLIPVSVFFELTYRCNLRCIHCYVSDSFRNRELSFAEIKSILNQLKKIGCLFLYFSGGEPFLRSDFIEIFKYARKQGFVVSVYTNATLLNKKLIAILKKFGVYEVHVSLYSIDSKIHEQITRVSGSFEKTTKNIKSMIDNGIGVVIKCPLTKINFYGYKNLLEWANQRKLRCVFTPYITAKNDGSKSTFALRLNNYMLKKALKDPLIDSFSAAQEKGLEDKFFVHVYDKTKSIPCFAGYNSCAINSVGDVFPCIQFLYKLGNLKKQTLKEIWGESKQVKLVRSIRTEQLIKCKNCKLQNFCARCPGLALVEDGDLYGKSSFECKLAKIRSKLHA